jgi:negative regulator of sigma E activity
MTDRENELLNRFLDGELSDADREEFENRMKDNSELVAMRDDFAVIGTMLREHIRCESEVADFSGFAAGIDRLIDLQEPAPTAAFESSVTTIDEEKTVAAPSNLLERAESWWRRNWTPVMLGAAAAAAVIFFVMKPTGPVTGIQPNDEVATATGTNGVVVDSISNEGKKTVLVSMPAQQDESTVIWLLDGEEDDQEAVEGEDPI